MENKNLIESLLEEIDRVKEVKTVYEKECIGMSGRIAIIIMGQSITVAEKAIRTMDTIGMVRALDDLRKYEL